MKYQQGSTLIMVLIVVLLVSIIATIALKDSILGTRLATSNQASNLLIENNNSALFNLEDPNKVVQRLAANGIYGYFLQPANTEDTLMFCYDSSRSDFFDITKASVLGSNKIGPNGICRGDRFAGGRSVVVSQVYVRKSSADSTQPFESSEEGIGIGSGSIGISIKVSATSISILPGLSNRTARQAAECFHTPPPPPPAHPITPTIDCLNNREIPYNVQEAEYIVGTTHTRRPYNATNTGANP